MYSAFGIKKKIAFNKAVNSFVLNHPVFEGDEPI